MLNKSLLVSMCLAVSAISAGPALADDCATVIASMRLTATTPYSTTVTGNDLNGNPRTSHMIRTKTKTYVETHGRWMALNITSEDLTETINEQLKTSKMTCQRVGTETVNGQATTIYTVHSESPDGASDNKLWLSAKNLPLKSESHIKGEKGTSSALYDYDHVQPPANATPVGGK